MGEFRHLDDRLVHQGYVWRVVTARFEAPDGSEFERDIVRSPGAVGVVPIITPSGHEPTVRLLRQYRPPYGREIFEIPAGMRDIPGEPPIETGRRELVEEAGLAARDLVHLIDIFPSPGMTDSVTNIFLATDCVAVERDVQGPEEEHMELVDLPLSLTLEMVDRGEIADAKTVTGLLMAHRRLNR